MRSNPFTANTHTNTVIGCYASMQDIDPSNGALYNVHKVSFTREKQQKLQLPLRLFCALSSIDLIDTKMILSTDRQASSIFHFHYTDFSTNANFNQPLHGVRRLETNGRIPSIRLYSFSSIPMTMVNTDIVSFPKNFIRSHSHYSPFEPSHADKTEIVIGQITT